jgi:hypothetical protein
MQPILFERPDLTPRPSVPTGGTLRQTLTVPDSFHGDNEKIPDHGLSGTPASPAFFDSTKGRNAVIAKAQPRFSLGQIVVTPGALQALQEAGQSAIGLPSMARSRRLGRCVRGRPPGKRLGPDRRLTALLGVPHFTR